MRMSVPPVQRVYRILRGSPCFLSPKLAFGRPMPPGLALAPGEECLGGIWGRSLESVVTDRGAHFHVGSSWKFVAYGDIEDVSFPDKSDPEGSLMLRTRNGPF